MGAGGALRACVSIGVWACHIGVLGASQTCPVWLKPPRRWEPCHGSTGHPGRRLSSHPVCQAGSECVTSVTSLNPQKDLVRKVILCILKTGD